MRIRKRKKCGLTIMLTEVSCSTVDVQDVTYMGSV